MTNKLPKAEYVGEIRLGENIIECAVLPDGTRVINQASFLRTLGRSRSPKQGTGVTTNVDELPFFLQSKSIRPFVPNDLEMSTTPIKYVSENGAEKIGYDAFLLPKTAEVYLQYRDYCLSTKGGVPANQQKMIFAADILIRGLANVGIAALVDEATGYQNKRENDALQKILDKFLTDEARKWAKTFPDEFWHKLIKVKGYPSYMALKRPSFVGHWVNDVVYSRIAPGIAKKLKEMNPSDEKGRRKHKHHQHFTEDQGLPELREHLSKVMVLMDAAANDREFSRLINRSLPKYGNTLDLPFE